MSELLKVYKDPQLTSRNPATLAKRAGVTLAAAKSFLRDREEAQVRKRAARLKKAAFVPTGDERGVWIGDTIYLNDYAGVNKGRSAIFTILETNSRYVYARALKAPTAAQTADALESIIEENREENREEKQVAPILKLRTDGGPEFSGAFAQLLEKLDIPHEKTGAGTHERLARLDRFHGTLRRMIGEYFALTGQAEFVFEGCRMYAVCCAIPDNDTPQVHDSPVWENWGCLEAVSIGSTSCTLGINFPHLKIIRGMYTRQRHDRRPCNYSQPTLANFRGYIYCGCIAYLWCRCGWIHDWMVLCPTNCGRM